jgi:putative redox protein
MGLTARARSIRGTLRQDVVIDGKHHLITDEPEDVGGDGSAPAPHELLPAALASCIATMLVMYARTKEWDLGDVAVDVDYDSRSTPRRFDVAIELGGDLTDEQLRRLEKCGARSRSASSSSRRLPARRNPIRYSPPRGAWRSLVSAPVWGTGGPEFESRRPDYSRALLKQGFSFRQSEATPARL